MLAHIHQTALYTSKKFIKRLSVPLKNFAKFFRLGKGLNFDLVQASFYHWKAVALDPIYYDQPFKCIYQRYDGVQSREAN